MITSTMKLRTEGVGGGGQFIMCGPLIIQDTLAHSQSVFIKKFFYLCNY